MYFSWYSMGHKDLGVVLEKGMTDNQPHCCHDYILNTSAHSTSARQHVSTAARKLVHTLAR